MPCKLSHQETTGMKCQNPIFLGGKIRETICMKCQSLFSIRKNYIKMSPAEMFIQHAKR